MAALSSLALAAAMASPEAQPWIKRHLPERNQWELGAFAGGFFIHREHDFYDPLTGPQKRIAKVGPEAGLRAAFFPLRFLGIEAEWSGVWTKVIAAADAPAFLYGFRGHVVAQLPMFRVTPFLLGGYGLLGVRSPRDVVGNDIDPAGHYGGGVKLFADARFAVRVEVRHFMAASQHRRNRIASHVSLIAGLSVRLGPQPSARRDRPAPTAPAPAAAPPPQDSDGDGRLDPADRCPWEAADTADGCEAPDLDGDGILDVDDACPREAGPTPTGCVPAPEPEPKPEPEPEPEPADAPDA